MIVTLAQQALAADDARLRRPRRPRLQARSALRWSPVALTAFLATTFGIMGGVGLSLMILGIATGTPAYHAHYAIGLVSPFLGAVAYSLSATGSLRPIARMYRPVRPGPGWWMILAAPASVVVAYAIAQARGLPLVWDALPSVGSLALGVIAWSSIMWAEETGWRGTLLPVLQLRFGPLAATGLVGLAWVIWHAPLLWLIGAGPTEVVFFSLQTFGLAAAMTWAWNRSGTTLVPVLIHGANNAVMLWLVAAVPSMTANELIGVQAAGPAALGLATVILTRGRLGFRSAPLVPSRQPSARIANPA